MRRAFLEWWHRMFGPPGSEERLYITAAVVPFLALIVAPVVTILGLLWWLL